MSENDAETGANPSPDSSKEQHGVLAAGVRLRRYEIVSVLGQGAFGVTYRARDTQLGREVAIKEYLPTALALRTAGTVVVPRSTEHAAEFAWGRDRFLEEARTLARLEDTPGIVRVYDFLEANGTAYMVMALARGQTLNRRLIEIGPLSADDVAKLVPPLLDGLEEVHALGFLHRDIKPANIIIDAGGLPTLIDFGASRAVMAGSSTAFTAIFTPGYAAPEQFTSAALGPWTDIYGLAATLYHAITGRAPPRAIDRLFEDRYEPLSGLQPPGFAPSLLSAIDAGLAVRATQRPQSIEAWRPMFAPGAPIAGRPASPDTAATAIMDRRRTRTGARSQPRAGAFRDWLTWPHGRRRRPLWIVLLILGVAAAFAGNHGHSFIRTALQTLTAETPAAPKGVTWTGTAQCAYWLDGKGGQGAPGPVTIDIPGGQGSGTFEFLTLAVALNVCGEQYTGTIRTTFSDGSKTLVGPFSGTISGNQIQARAAVRAETKTDFGVNESECTIKLSSTSGAALVPPQSSTPHDGQWFGGITCKGERTAVQGKVADGSGLLSGGAVGMCVRIAGDSAVIEVAPGDDARLSGSRAGPSGKLTGKLSGRSIYAQGRLGGNFCTVSLVGP